MSGLVASVDGLPDRVLEQARHRPGAPALLWAGERVSYGELREMVDAARSDLERLGLAREGRVGILAPKSPRAIALILACLLDRRPVLLPSVNLGAETLQRLLEQAGCGHVLSLGPALGADRAELRCEVVRAAPGTGRHRVPPAGAGDVALLLTTSGSTGMPKIVPLALPAIDRFTDWAGSHFAITSGSTVFSYAPLNFDLCLLDIWARSNTGDASLWSTRTTRPTPATWWTCSPPARCT